ncbi:unnamed protein product [Diamesa hyperborea]
MASLPKNSIFIQIESSAEQQENIKNCRKSLKVLQNTNTKENSLSRVPAYIGKQMLIKKTSPIDCETPEIKRIKPSTSATTQTSPTVVKEDDLTSDVPGEIYWETLAEKRRSALEESLSENQELYERIAVLEDELNQSKKMLEETRNLVEVLTEMIEEETPVTPENSPVPQQEEDKNEED